MLFMHTSLNFLESCCSVAAQNSIAASNVAKIWIWEGLVLKILYSLLPNPLHIKKLLGKSSNHISFAPTKKKDPTPSKLWVFSENSQDLKSFCFLKKSKATRRVLTSQILGSTFGNVPESLNGLGCLSFVITSEKWGETTGKKNPQKEPKSSQAIGFLKKRLMKPCFWGGYVTGMV